MLTTAVMTDLPVISNILSRLFESSQLVQFLCRQIVLKVALYNQCKKFPICSVHSRYLDDVSLHHLINALCSLSMEAMEMAYGNNKVTIFQSYQAHVIYRNVFFFFGIFCRMTGSGF